MADLIGQMLGNYQVIEQIGLGGMATVYKAYQASMDRFVAIKVLPRQLAEDPTFIGRFEQEARTLAKLEHKHILPVHDFGTQEGYTYLVMRYVGSGTLKDRIKDAPLPLQDAVDYLTQIAGALGYAHERGVIYRDVKSSNVLIGDENHAYLTDFGIAKLAAGPTNQFTGTGAIIGTPAYMSPEQCAGMPVDARSDLYSLGIVLYEMLTGRVPFDAETPVAVVFKHMQEPLPSPRALNPAIPEAVEQVVLRALAKNPDERYQTARDMSDALRDAMTSISEKRTAGLRVPPIPLDTTLPSATQKIEPSVPVSTRKIRWLLPVGLLLIAAVVIGGIVLFSGNRDQTKEKSNVPTTAAQSSAGSDVTSTWTIYTSTTSTEPDNRQLISADSGLWMSSDGGLVHWAADASSYTKYTATDGLPYHSIQTMVMDQAGYLWIGGGSDQPGLIRLHSGADGKPDQIETFNSGNSSLRSDYVWDLLPEADGTLLAATFDSYIEQWDGQEWVSSPTVPSAGLEVIGDRLWSLQRTKDGTLWAGGPHGLMRLNGGQWVAVPLPADLIALEQEEYDVIHLHEDPADGSLWVNLYTSPQYQTYTLHLMPPVDSAHDPVWIPVDNWVPVPLMDLLRDSSGNLWMVGFDTLLLIDGVTGQRTTFTREQGIPGITYHALVQDKNGTIWLTTELALVQYDGHRWISFTIDNEPPTNSLRAMAEAADGTLWFASDFGILAAFKDGTWTNKADLQVEINDMAMLGSTLWLATGDGLIQWADGAVVQQFRPDSPGLSSLRVLTLAVDPNQPDLLWIGTMEGLDRLNTADGSWTHVSDLPGGTVYALHFDSAGALWVGMGAENGDTPIGVTRFDGTTWTVMGQIGAPFRQEERAVLSMADDGQGGMWVGTDGFLYHWDGSVWTPVTEEEGGPIFTPILGIVSAGDVTWVASFYGGLYRLDDKGWYAFGNEGVGTVILRRLYRTSDGALWILSHDGVVRLIGDPLQ